MIVYIFLGIAAGILLTVSNIIFPGLYWFLFLSVFVCLAMLKVSSKEERRFIVYVFMSGFFLRSIAAVCLYISNLMQGWGGFTSGDESIYFKKSVFIAKYGFQAINPMATSADVSSIYGLNGFSVIGSIYCAMFGDDLLGFKFINVFIGSLIPVAAFFFVKEIFGKTTACLSALLLMTFPSLIMWSSAGLKESLIMLCILLVFYGFYKIFVRRQTGFTPVLLFCFLLLWSVQKVIVFVCILSMIIFLYLQLSKIRKAIILSGISAVLIIVLLQHPALLDKSKYRNIIGEKLYTMAAHQISQIHGDEAGYILFPYLPQAPHFFPVFYNHIVPPTPLKYKYFLFPDDVAASKIVWPSFFYSYMKGIAYTLLSPFLWDINSFNQLQAYPQMIVWYCLLPFFITGVGIALRYRFNEMAHIVFFMIALYSLFAMTEGNIGAVFRHRDWITPFYIMFGAAGLLKVFFKKYAFKERGLKCH